MHYQSRFLSTILTAPKSIKFILLFPRLKRMWLCWVLRLARDSVELELYLRISRLFFGTVIVETVLTIKNHGQQPLVVNICNPQFTTLSTLILGLPATRQVFFYWFEGTIYMWDLLNGRPLREFKCKYFSSVNILCEIGPLNIIAVVQESKQIHTEQFSYVGSSQHTQT